MLDRQAVQTVNKTNHHRNIYCIKSQQFHEHCRKQGDDLGFLKINCHVRTLEVEEFRFEANLFVCILSTNNSMAGIWFQSACKIYFDTKLSSAQIQHCVAAYTLDALKCKMKSNYLSMPTSMAHAINLRWINHFPRHTWQLRDIFYVSGIQELGTTYFGQILCTVRYLCTALLL